MGKVISFLNFKGGVGKSTSTVNTAKALHDMGYKILVIDADAQGNSSKMMGKKLSEGNDETLYEAMTKGMDIRECICMDQDKEDSFDYVGSNQKLGYAEMELVTKIGRENILKKVIQPIINDYDFILIDCAPIDGLVSQNAITASDYIVVPLNGERQRQLANSWLCVYFDAQVRIAWQYSRFAHQAEREVRLARRDI